MSRTETEDIPCRVIDETESAYKLANQKGAEAWFPKSQMHFKQRNVKTGEAVACIPVWLIVKKEW